VSGKSALIPFENLVEQFAWIKEHAEGERDARIGNEDQFPVPVMTGADRDEWAARRTDLLSISERNQRTLRSIESSSFVVCLDDTSDEKKEDAEVYGRILHGNGRNRWFDKSFELTIAEDGNSGINIEHSWAEAPVPLDLFFKHSLPYAREAQVKMPVTDPVSAGLQWAKPQRLVWDLDDQMKTNIVRIASAIDAAITDSDKTMQMYPGCGKKVWKECGLSPDAAFQMALQIAYRTLDVKPMEGPVATYETVGLTRYFKGRTECCRVVSNDSEAMVKAMLDYHQHGGDEKKSTAATLLRKACGAHLKYISEAQAAEGIDRHLLGLRLMLGGNAQKYPLFSHEGYSRSGGSAHFILSSSNNSYIANDGAGGFGSVVHDGYGVCYMVRPDFTQCTIESKHSCKDTSSAMLSACLQKSLELVKEVALSDKPKPKL
jgi:carnitine O-acetyltransferase